MTYVRDRYVVIMQKSTILQTLASFPFCEVLEPMYMLMYAQ